MPGWNQKQVLGWVSLFVTAALPRLLLAAEGDAKSPGSAARPNFVFVLVDDLRYDAMSCAGHPFVKTPNIDRIATNGVRFTNAFVTLSLCAPSRAAFLTGIYNHVNGVPTNEGQELDPAKFATYPRLLRDAGYETAFIGKWHQGPTSDPRPGFDYWLSFRGQGVYIDPQLNENGREFKAQGYMTDLLTQAAVDFLKRPRSRPFSLCLWHKAVHGPFTPAERHKDLYRDVQLPEPPSFRDTFEGKPAWQRRMASPGGKAKDEAGEPVPRSIPPEPWQPRNAARLDYYRALAAVDESVGRVLAALKETGQLDNTVVIFAGDNGFFMGEHRRGDKRLAYEESLRIPLLMCGPGVAKPGSTREQMVLNIDMAPTILDMAGLKPAAGTQGRSFKAILAGEDPAWRKSFLFEYYQEAWLPRIPTLVGVRTADWKYVTYPTIQDLDELYDLRNDPNEMKNLAADPAARHPLELMKAELDRLKKETGYTLVPPSAGRRGNAASSPAQRRGKKAAPARRKP
ncbi:MAG: sulfatase family protein [Phycisphaerae bacterium]